MRNIEVIIKILITQITMSHISITIYYLWGSMESIKKRTYQLLKHYNCKII